MEKELHSILEVEKTTALITEAMTPASVDTSLEILKAAGLSNREAEVILEVCKGDNSRDIGARLFVTEKTVKFHLTNIYKKLGVVSRAKAMVVVAAMVKP